MNGPVPYGTRLTGGCCCRAMKAGNADDLYRCGAVYRCGAAVPLWGGSPVVGRSPDRPTVEWQDQLASGTGRSWGDLRSRRVVGSGDPAT
ncbi:MAG: hypothetical protein RIK87_28595, partial [Fuerstiella sp.]